MEKHHEIARTAVRTALSNGKTWVHHPSYTTKRDVRAGFLIAEAKLDMARELDGLLIGELVIAGVDMLAFYQAKTHYLKRERPRVQHSQVVFVDEQHVVLHYQIAPGVSGRRDAHGNWTVTSSDGDEKVFFAHSVRAHSYDKALGIV